MDKKSKAQAKLNRRMERKQAAENGEPAEATESDEAAESTDDEPAAPAESE